MILITSLGEFLLSFFFPVYILLLVCLVSVHSLFFLGNPNPLGRTVSWLLGVCLVFTTGIYVLVGKEL